MEQLLGKTQSSIPVKREVKYQRSGVPKKVEPKSLVLLSTKLFGRTLDSPRKETRGNKHSVTVVSS